MVTTLKLQALSTSSDQYVRASLMLMTLNHPKLTSIAYSICILCSGTVYGVTGLDSLQIISLEESTTQAAQRVLECRLRLAEWNLSELECMREEGYASWLECQRQQLAVDTLAALRDAADESHRMALMLKERVHTTKVTASQNRQANQFSPFIFSLPSSLRVVAWIEPDQMSPALMRRYVDSYEPAESEVRRTAAAVTTAEEQVERAKLYLDKCSTTDNSAVHQKRLKQAQLHLELAEAVLAEATIQNRNNLRRSEDSKRLHEHLESLVQEEISNSSSQSAIDEFINVRASRTLLESTVQVSVAEAAATGIIQAAEIEVRRSEFKLAATQLLYADGHASRQELDFARSNLQVARGKLEELRAQQQGLEESCDELVSSLAGVRSNEIARQIAFVSKIPPDDLVKLKDMESLPSTLLSNPAFVQHLLDLRKLFFATEAKCLALQHKFEMLTEYLARCEELESLRRPDDTSTAENDELARLQETLRDGNRRICEELRLDLQHVVATKRSMFERLNIIALEETRFVVQATRQQNAHADFHVQTEQNTGRKWPHQRRPLVQQVSLKVPSSRNISRRISYLESSHAVDIGQTCSLAFSADDLEFAKFVEGPFPRYRRFSRSAAVMNPISSRRRYPEYFNTTCTASVLGGLRSQCFDLGVRTSCYGVQEIGSTYATDRFGPSVRQTDTYPFGILRSDLISRGVLPPGVPHWYIPGAPQNYQPR